MPRYQSVRWSSGRFGRGGEAGADSELSFCSGLGDGEGRAGRIREFVRGFLSSLLTAKTSDSSL